jgi:hypothetical protein
MSEGEKNTVRSIIESLAAGRKTSEIAKDMPGISEKPLRAALKKAGYFFQAGGRGWTYIGEGEEPLDRSIFDFAERGSSGRKSSSSKVHSNITPSNTRVEKSNTNITSNSRKVHSQFTPDEVQALRDMIEQWREKEASSADQPENSLHDRIKQLPQNEKTRKTIVIDENIGSRLDRFCKVERVNKSDVLHLAIYDFLEKF